jgi:hypothetical protein
LQSFLALTATAKVNIRIETCRGKPGRENFFISPAQEAIFNAGG